LPRLSPLKEAFPFIEEVRGRGLLLAIQLNEDYSDQGKDIQGDLVNKGFLMDFHKASSSFRFFPPFTITRKEIDCFAEAFHETLSELSKT
jgi:acetylornithine/succinyldiaminopimelate/putrescine aminotransferase